MKMPDSGCMEELAGKGDYQGRVERREAFAFELGLLSYAFLPPYSRSGGVLMVSLALSDRITALREGLPPETAARIVPAARLRAEREAPPLSTGIDALDRLLGGGLLRGKLVEIVGRRSCGRFAAVLSALGSATRGGENAALVDLGDALDPDGASAADVDLVRLLWVRPRDPKDAVYAAEVVIAAGFPFVAVDLGFPPIGRRIQGAADVRRIPDAAWVRLARGARAHGAALLVASPHPVAGTAAEAVLRLERAHAGWTGGGRSLRLLTNVAGRFAVEKKRGEKPGREGSAEWTFPGAVAGERSGGDARASGPATAAAPRPTPAGARPAHIAGADIAGA